MTGSAGRSGGHSFVGSGFTTCATLCEPLDRSGAHPKYIQAQLGHASIQTTLDRYGHLMPDAHAAEARKLDRLVFGETGGGGAVRTTADAVQRLQNGCRNEEGVSGGDR